MSDIPISSLPLAVSLNGSEAVPIVQGGTTKRTTTADISAQALSGYVPTSRRINTLTDSGLNGGGSLATDLNLQLSVNNLAEKITPTIGDFLAMNDATVNAPVKVSPSNFYKTIGGLTHKSVPMTVDRLPLYSVADSDSRYSTVAEVLAAAGSVPAGGTTGQPLIKRSDADFDTLFATLPVNGGGTGATTLTTHGVLLGQGTAAITATAAMTDAQLLIGQTGADPLPQTVTGDVTISAAGVTAIGVNKVTDSMLRQSAGLSVIGNATNATADVADIVAGSDFQVLRRSGTAVAFGAIDLSQSGAVGSSVLGPVNGGTGVNNGASTLTLGGSLTTSGAFPSTFTMTGNTSVTFPTSGTLATTSGASIPAVAQGDLLYGSATNTLSTLAKNTTATRYLANTGASNSPAWDQVNLANGVAAQLPLANGGTNANLTASNGGIFYSTGSAGAILSGTATAAQMLQSGSSAAPVWSTATWPATTTANQLLYSSGANTVAGLASANTGVLTTNSSGVPSITAQAALTKTDDTNVTLTLGGSPSTALLNAASLSLGWTGTLAVSRGGTGSGSHTAYAVLCGGTTTTGALQSIASVGTSGQVLTSNGAGALPTFQTVGGTGTVTAVAAGTGLAASPSPITSSGTLSLASIATGNVLANISGSSGAPTATLISALGLFATVKIQVFTSSGTYTPSAGMLFAIIECQGGGGGGGGITGQAAAGDGAGGGGSGGYSRTIASIATIGASKSVTIGASGVGGSTGTNDGGTGGTTSVGSICIALGGSGGLGCTGGGFGQDGGAGGVAGTGSFASPGQTGGSALGSQTGAFIPAGGAGANSMFGGGGAPDRTLSVSNGGLATGYGAGGAGAAAYKTTATANGGYGSPGLVIITEYCSQ